MSNHTFPQKKEVYISFIAPININTTQILLNTIGQFISQGFSKVIMLFSTPGGMVNEGITLYNTLRALPIKLIIHSMGTIDSIGYESNNSL